MKTPSRRSWIAASVLLLSLLSPTARAAHGSTPQTGGKHGSGNEDQTDIPRSDVIKAAAGEWNELADRYKDKPEALNFVKRSQQYFDVNAARKDKLTHDSYAPWEFQNLSEMVNGVILPHIRKEADVIADSSLTQEQKDQKHAANKIELTTMAHEFTMNSAKKFGSDIEHTLLVEASNGNPAGKNGGAAVKMAAKKIGESLTTPEDEARRQERVNNSDITKLGIEAATWAVDPKAPPLVPVPPAGGATVPTGNPNGPINGGPTGSASGGAAPNTASGDLWGPFLRASNGAGVVGVADRGAYELQQGNYAKALDLAQSALRVDPGNLNALAVLHSAKGRGDALDAGAAGLKSANAGAAAFAPSGFAGAGPLGGASPSPEIAAAALSGAARVAGDQARAGALNALKLGDAQGALGILSKALTQNPNNPALLNLRAQTYGSLGRWDEALKDAVAGLALAPGNMVLLNTQALAQNRSHRYQDALRTADLMIAADPRNPWGYANRAHAEAGLGNREAMLADINRAAALDPRFKQAAADAAQLQLPSDSDVMFLFPGESAKGASKAPAASAPGRGRSFSVVVGAGLFGGLLLALGLLSTVMAPIKDSVVSAFTRVNRTGPTTGPVVTAQPASVAGNVGGLIRGQYEISRQIGAGGMGMVYEGTDRSLGRRVAIKKMRDELRLNARERDRFIIEAKTVASLHHPNIVDIYAIAEEGEDVYLVFEYVDGKTVHDLVQAKGRLDPAESVRVTRSMGDALAYAHAHGVIHRDMKPSNVMVTSAGQVKVMDFGIARMAKDALTRYSMTNTVVGTPPYMAPEQEQGVVRKESDVYSLAVCAYEMLTGKMPFVGIGAGMLMNKINMSYIPPARAIAGLPEALDEVFLKAFQADPDQRYHTPQEFVTALSAAADGARAKAG